MKIIYEIKMIKNQLLIVKFKWKFIYSNLHIFLKQKIKWLEDFHNNKSKTITEILSTNYKLASNPNSEPLTPHTTSIEFSLKSSLVLITTSTLLLTTDHNFPSSSSNHCHTLNNQPQLKLSSKDTPKLGIQTDDLHIILYW